jgi:hypothetical protein
MSPTTFQERARPGDLVPAELLELQERIRAQPTSVRADLEPLVEEAMEHARFRGRAMSLAQVALERFRLDLAMLEFDLEVTRREREELRERLGDEGDQG